MPTNQKLRKPQRVVPSAKGVYESGTAELQRSLAWLIKTELRQGRSNVNFSEGRHHFEVAVAFFCDVEFSASTSVAADLGQEGGWRYRDVDSDAVDAELLTPKRWPRDVNTWMLARTY